MPLQISPGKIAAALGLALLLVFVAEVLILFSRIRVGMDLSGRSVPFEARLRDARAKVLVIGDSTGVGTGSSDPADSVAGRIARDFPGVEIVNRARNGARAADVPAQLVGAGNGRYDVILLQVGGNDILRFTPLDELRASVAGVLGEAARKARAVVFISTGNVGLSPAFFPPLNWVYTWRTRSARALFMEAAQERGVQYVDLFRERGRGIFEGDPGRYYAPDFLHPSGEGYGVWYRELLRQSDIASRIDAGRPDP